MKKFLVPFFLFLAALRIATAQDLNVDYPRIELPDGRSLIQARVTQFDGVTFSIEHRAGIAHIAWSEMPAEWQARFRNDPDAAKRIALLRETKADLDKIQKRAEAQADEARAHLAEIATKTPSREPVIGMEESAVAELWGWPRRRTVNKDGEHLRETWHYKAATLYFTDARLARIER